MRTLLICPALYGSTGGIERILQLYLRTLLDTDPTNDQVRLAVLNDESLPPAIAAECEKSVASGRHRFTFLRHVMNLARGSDGLLCGHVNLLPLTACAAFMSSAGRYALIAHGIEVWEKSSRLTRWALRGADRIFCVSEFTRTRMLELDARLKPERLIVLPNALDAGFAEATRRLVPAAHTTPVVLTVSRLNKADNYKGIDHLIAAMPAVRRVVPNARLRIVGDGDDRARLETLARKLQDDDAITFLGRVADSALQHEFQHCRLFALPSAKEGFGLVYLEAMAFGKPCIAAEAGGAPEVISPKSGRLVPFGDVPALADEMAKALTQPWDIQAIQARAAEFSPERFASRFSSLWSLN